MFKVIYDWLKKIINSGCCSFIKEFSQDPSLEKCIILLVTIPVKGHYRFALKKHMDTNFAILTFPLITGDYVATIPIENFNTIVSFLEKHKDLKNYITDDMDRISYTLSWGSKAEGNSLVFDWPKKDSEYRIILDMFRDLSEFLDDELVVHYKNLIG